MNKLFNNLFELMKSLFMAIYYVWRKKLQIAVILFVLFIVYVATIDDLQMIGYF